MNTTTKNMAESARMSDHPLLRARSERQCYRNAFLIIDFLDEYAEADYVEGQAVIQKVMVVEHAWIERDGVIVDPTLPVEDLTYFPGLRIKGKKGLEETKQFLKSDRPWEQLPLFSRIDSPEYRAAMVTAYRFVGAEEVANQYEDAKEPLEVSSV